MNNFIKLVVVGLLINTPVGACTFLENLTYPQYDIAYQTYRTGEKYDLGLTAVAVAYEESKLGLYKVRLGEGKDQSYGVFHTALHWKTKGMSAFEKGLWAQEMVFNDAKSINTGVSDLLRWRKSAKGDWKRMVEQYNAGYGSNPDYVERVVAYVNELKKCEF